MPNAKIPKELDTLLRNSIRNIPDYPKPGVMFKDITPLLKDGKAFGKAIDALAKSVADIDFDYVVGIEARGFIVGSALSYKLSKGFVPIRKKGKLPYRKVSLSYALEYGTETVEIHEDAIEKGRRVLIVDDLLATGGTARASGDLVKQIGAEVAGYAFLIELPDLKGRKMLKDARVEALVEY